MLMPHMLAVRVKASPSSRSLTTPRCHLPVLMDHHVGLVASLSHALPAWRVQSGLLLPLTELRVELIDAVDGLLVLGDDV